MEMSNLHGPAAAYPIAYLYYWPGICAERAPNQEPTTMFAGFRPPQLAKLRSGGGIIRLRFHQD